MMIFVQDKYFILVIVWRWWEWGVKKRQEYKNGHGKVKARQGCGNVMVKVQNLCV